MQPDKRGRPVTESFSPLELPAEYQRPVGAAPPAILRKSRFLSDEDDERIRKGWESRPAIQRWSRFSVHQQIDPSVELAND